jgi:hypothetical protein
MSMIMQGRKLILNELIRTKNCKIISYLGIFI